MAAPLTDSAIVLRLTEYSETSQIVTLFTRDAGLVRAIAKGARRSTKTRFAVGLDLLEHGELGYLPARGEAQLATLTDWAQRDSFAGLRGDLLRLAGGLYAAELTAALTEEVDPHPALFDALLALLTRLAGAEPAAPLLPAFQADLLTAIGYAPNLAECVVCGRAAPAGAAAFFSAGAGGLLCRNCEVHHVEKRRVPRGLLGTPPGQSAARAWFELLDYHLSHLAGRPFQAAAAVRERLG